MADISPEGATESPAQRSARLRREKRAAKIAAEGADRLARITQLSGRPAPAPEEPSLIKDGQRSAPPPPPPPPPAAHADDPDEVDISDHHYTPRLTPRSTSGSSTPFDQRLSPFGPAPPPPQNPNSSSSEDPMMRMMQQLLSGDPSALQGDPSDPANPLNDMPPFMKAMLSAQSQTQQQAAAQAGVPLASSAYLWRVVHGVFALGLALWMALSSSSGSAVYTGSKASRGEAGALGLEGVTAATTTGPKLFYVFATAELVLQSSRYFVEGGRLQGSGWLATIANSGLVPEPWGGYVRIVGRYAVIWQTVVADAMLVVFVLGCLAWWRGEAEGVGL